MWKILTEHRKFAVFSVFIGCKRFSFGLSKNSLNKLPSMQNDLQKPFFIVNNRNVFFDKKKYWKTKFETSLCVTCFTQNLKCHNFLWVAKVKKCQYGGNLCLSRVLNFIFIHYVYLMDRHQALKITHHNLSIYGKVRIL